MKTIPELISENPIGTVFDTEKELPEAQDFTKTMLGKKFRCVLLTIVIECEDGSLITLKSNANDFDPRALDEEEEEEYDKD